MAIAEGLPEELRRRIKELRAYRTGEARAVTLRHRWTQPHHHHYAPLSHGTVAFAQVREMRDVIASMVDGGTLSSCVRMALYRIVGDSAKAHHPVFVGVSGIRQRTHSRLTAPCRVAGPGG